MAGLTVAELEAVVGVDQRPFEAGMKGVLKIMGTLPKNARGMVSETSREFYALSPAMRAAVLNVKAETAAGLAKAADEFQRLPDAAEEAAEQTTTALGESMRALPGKLKASVAGAGVVVGGLFMKGMQSGMTFEDMEAHFVAELGVSSSRAAELGAAAGRLYADNYGDSLEEVSAAFTTVVTSVKGMRNATGSEIEAMAAKALTFADVFEVDITRATQVAGQAVKTGLAKDTADAFDMLTVTMQRVPKALREDVLDAADEYGQFFTQLGIGGERAFAMLAASAGKGMYGIDKTGDALKEFTIRATDMSDSTQTAYDSLGLSQQKMTDDLLAGGKRGARAFDMIVQGLDAVKSPAKQSQVALALFGTPLEDLGTSGIGKFVDSLAQGGQSLGDFRGATDKAANAVGNTASANLSKFGRQVMANTVQVIGGKVIPALSSLTAWMGTNVGPSIRAVLPVLAAVGAAMLAFAGFIDSNRTPIMVVAGLITAVFLPGLIALGVTSTATAITTAASWVLMQAGAIRAAAVHSVAVVGMVAGWVLMGAQSLIQAGRMAAAWLIAMGPVGLVIAVVVGLVALIIAKWSTIKKFTVKVFTSIVGFLKQNGLKILAVLTGPIGLVVLAIAKNWGKIKTLFRAGISAVVGFSKALPGKIGGALRALPGVIGGAFAKAMTAGLEKVRGIGATIVGWISGIPAKIGALGARFATAGRALLQKFIDGMKNAAGIITGIAGNVWTAVKGLLNGAISRINSALEFEISIPGPNIHVNPPNIPQLATGARATGATLAVIGEGREPESVLPDSVLRGLLERAHASGAAGQQGSDGPNDRRSLMRDAVFQVSDKASARDLIGELSHALRVSEHGGVYAGA